MNHAPFLAEFHGINGFLGTRASIMLDVVFLAMFLVLPVLAWSIAHGAGPSSLLAAQTHELDHRRHSACRHRGV